MRRVNFKNEFFTLIRRRVCFIRLPCRCFADGTAAVGTEGDRPRLIYQAADNARRHLIDRHSPSVPLSVEVARSVAFLCRSKRHGRLRSPVVQKGTVGCFVFFWSLYSCLRLP